MCKTRFTESQIVKILKAAEGGRAVTDLCRMKELEAENAWLEQMFAELSLENNVLKDVIEKTP